MLPASVVIVFLSVFGVFLFFVLSLLIVIVLVSSFSLI